MPAGRPRIELNEEMVEKLAAIGCTVQEIADIMGVGDSTIKRNYDLPIKTGRAVLHMSLKRKQVELAKAGNTTMLIWLGKQYLSQSDKVEQKVSVQERVEIPDSVVDKALEAALAYDADALGDANNDI